MKQETVVVIVGAGPAGIATLACLNLLSIPNIVLEREDCYASLWKKKAYDRLKLHLAKTFVNSLIWHFRYPLYQRSVESARYDSSTQKWVVTAKNSVLGLVEEYVDEFLVVATDENSEGYIPNIYGLDNFKGLVIHSSEYEIGKKFGDEKVLVVGAGNSGMEIAYDLCNWGAQTSIVICSPIHVLTKELVQLGMYLLKYIPCTFVDKMVLTLSKLLYGDIDRYGIQMPRKGPFSLKKDTRRSPVIDVGTILKIKAREIEEKQYDAIAFSTGFKSTVRKWLKDDGGLFNEKREYGLYCVGFASVGLFGI
ncbi:putative indole-3-pyruvate monooxygenase YUCCA10 [Bidens hawaiensis]|uniref:putative indole-3-pyruvate monooxygenase YUCCA10 n=1 Tax=Bidens hawaiensis TaxID=980011 RepID=UPI00404A80D3